MRVPLVPVGCKSAAAMAASKSLYHHRVQELIAEISEQHACAEGSDPRIGAAIDDLRKASDLLRKANI